MSQFLPTFNDVMNHLCHQQVEVFTIDTHVPIDGKIVGVHFDYIEVVGQRKRSYFIPIDKIVAVAHPAAEEVPSA